MKRIIIPQSLVPALRDGRKTQHRVPVSVCNSTVLGYPARPYWNNLLFDHATVRDDNPLIRAVTGMHVPGRDVHLGVPFRHPEDPPWPVNELAIYRVRPVWEVGEELWVPETWCEASPEHRDRHGVRQAIYKANTSGDGDDIRQEYIRLGHAYRWRSPATMPRWASRFVLTITDVRVERDEAGWAWVPTFTLRQGGGR